MAEEKKLADSGELAFDNEYSRLLAVIGRDALERLQKNKVLVSGMCGLGMEVAKNLALMGVKKLTIHDPEAVALRDLSSNFFLAPEDVGKNRAEAVRTKLHELNDRCDLQVHTGELTEEVLAEYRIVVQTNNHSLEDMKRVNNFCHARDITYIASDAFGVTGYIFTDFGLSHTITDRTGERPKTGYLASYADGMCICIDRHDLEDGMVVRMSEVQGIPTLNGREFKVSVKGPYIFSLEDVGEHEGQYVKGGLFEQVKQPTVVDNFETLEQQLSKPLDIWSKVVFTDHSKMMETPSHLVATLALLKFREAHGGALPKTHDEADAAEVVALAKEINAATPHQEGQLDEEYVARFAHTSRGDLNPMAAFLGGILSQEAIKASSGKYTPINQWLFFDGVEALPTGPVDPADYVEHGTRYDGQVAVFGNAFQRTLGEQRYFLVGAGAIGCEMLKNWAMIGLGAQGGQLVLTDNDVIEISNLNRQFLFRSWDVSQPKSETAAKAAANMNPDLNITPYTTKVCPDTEDVFNDAFWQGLSGVTNALDNVKARLYVDGKCAFFGKSLLESGTLGTKGNTQVVVPHLSATYGETSDPEPKEQAKCLLHSFPSNIEHCLQWARELLFEGEFVTNPEHVNDYIADPEYLDKLSAQERKAKLDILGSMLVDRQTSLDDCVRWARDLFEEIYVRKPAQLLHTFPLDAVDSAGQPFWQGTRRPPKPTVFDSADKQHLDFIVSATYLRAYTLGIIESENEPDNLEEMRTHIREVADAVTLAPFVPKDAVKIQYDENEEQQEDGVNEEDERRMAEILAKLPKRSELKPMNVVDFEKDVDANQHVTNIAAAANIRAEAYGIKQVSRLQAKLIAGRIIAAIVTTTAAVTGLVCMELYKLVQGKKELSSYRNSFLNLALPLFNLADPTPPATYNFKGKKYTTWDHIDIKGHGDITLQQLIDILRDEHKVETEQVLFEAGKGLQPLYVSYLDYSANLSQKVSQLVAESLAPGQNKVKLIITPDDDDDDDMMMDEGDDDKEEDQVPPVYVFFSEDMEVDQ